MTLQYRPAVDPQQLTASLVSAARCRGSSHAPLYSYGAPPSFREFQTKPRTQFGVMWSHGCPNWLVEIDTKVFEKHFSFLPFCSQQNSFSKTFPFVKPTVRVKTHLRGFLVNKFSPKTF